MTTPVFRALATQLGAEVHLLTKRQFQSVVADNPYLRNTYCWSEGAVVPQLRSERYDLIVDLHGNLRSHLLTMRLGVPAVGFRKRNLEKSLLGRGIDLLGRMHLVDRYFRSLRPLGVRDDGEGLDYSVRDAEVAAAERLTTSLGRGYVAVVLGATHVTKRMTTGFIAEVVERLDRPTVLLGGPDVRELAAAVSGQLEGRGAVMLNLCGSVPLRDSIAVLAKASGVVTGDTGLMHAAAALGRPMVVVWGNTVPQLGLYPYYAKAEVGRCAYAEVGGLGCRPCSRIGYESCPRGHFKCMHEQQATGTVEHLRRLMASSGSA